LKVKIVRGKVPADRREEEKEEICRGHYASNKDGD
jgi:hypothetical protein